MPTDPWFNKGFDLFLLLLLTDAYPLHTVVVDKPDGERGGCLCVEDQ